ncbi:MAG: YncE family protein [Bryobacteraceae bacterium]|jgi:DNA-binding beta-propeller fold protein YncE
MRPFAVLALAIMSASAADTGNTAKSWLLVANKGEHTLGIVDPASGKQVAAVDEGGVTGHEVIASPDGRTAYVPIYGDSGVGKPGTDGTHLVAIDLANRKISGTVDFGRGVRPHCPMFGPKNGMLYVSTELDQSISLIDPHSLKITGKIPTGQPESHMFSITADGKRAYTANVGPGTVSALDLVGKKTIAVIPVAKHVQRMSISADDKYAFTSDVDAPRLAVIDTSSNKVKQWIELPAPGYGSAVTSDNKWLVIAIPTAHKVAAIDLATMKVAHTVDVPAAPQETLIRPDRKVAYVSCDASSKVAEIDLATWQVTRLIDTGKGADGLAWSGK